MLTVKAFREDGSMHLYPATGGVSFSRCDRASGGTNEPSRHVSGQVFFQIDGSGFSTELNLGDGPSDNYRVTVENGQGVRIEDWRHEQVPQLIDPA